MKKRNIGKSGYYTVEAVFIVTICIWVIMALAYSGLYVHDRMIVMSEMNQKLAEQLQRGEDKITQEWKDRAKESIEGRLFLMRIQKAEVKKGVASVDMTLTYELPISLQGLKSVFSDGKKYKSLSVTRELVKPTKYKWDIDILRGKEK